MTFTFHRNDATFSAISSTDVSNITNIATAWTTYNPNITAASGAFTTVSGAGRYQQIGKTVAIFIQITVTSSGTAGGAVLADLPVNAVSNTILAGRENIVSGSMLQSILLSSSAKIFKYDNSLPAISAGAVLLVSGIYESV
jgi:hypothetical protein